MTENLGLLSHFVYLDLTTSAETDAERLVLERARKAVEPNYRSKPSTRPDFPGGAKREVPEKPSFPGDITLMGIAAQLRSGEFMPIKEFFDIFPRLPVLVRIVLIMLIFTFISMGFGLVSPNSINMLFLRSIFFLGLFFVFIYMSFYVAANYLDQDNILIRTGLLAITPSVTLGSMLYSLCLFLFSSKPSSCYVTDNTSYLFERFGRFVFFGYPISVGMILALCAFVNLFMHKEENVMATSIKHIGKNKPAILTFFLVMIHMSISPLITSHIKELNLAFPAPDMGDVDLVSHLGVTLFLSVTLFLGIFYLERRSNQLWNKYGRDIFFVIQPVIIIIFLTLLYTNFQWPGDIMPAGTGIGVIVTLIIFSMSIMMLVAFAVRKIMN
jgi:hypothetical protein